MRALAVNSWVLLGAIGAGWLLAAIRGAVLPVDATVALDVEDYWFIASNNTLVLLSLTAGALSLGAYTLIVVIWNGYHLGLGLASIAQAASGPTPLTMPHVWIEFAAILLAASVAHVLAADLVRCLAGVGPLRIRPVTVVLAVAELLILVAAAFEVWGVF